MDEKIKAFLDKLKTPVSELWEKNKIFLIVFGLIVLAVKFRDVLINILVSGANKDVKKAQESDTVLAKEESDANAKANELVKKANDAPSSETPVDNDWYKKGK